MIITTSVWDSYRTNNLVLIRDQLGRLRAWHHYRLVANGVGDFVITRNDILLDTGGWIAGEPDQGSLFTSSVNIDNAAWGTPPLLSPDGRTAYTVQLCHQVNGTFRWRWAERAAAHGTDQTPIPAVASSGIQYASAQSPVYGISTTTNWAMGEWAGGQTLLCGLTPSSDANSTAYYTIRIDDDFAGTANREGAWIAATATRSNGVPLVNGPNAHFRVAGGTGLLLGSTTLRHQLAMLSRLR